MRPRELPAEDPSIGCRPRTTPHSFNEAAGVTRGRRTNTAGLIVAPSCFNEAAGVTRGRRVHPFHTRGKDHSFNEAAGVTRGRRHREHEGEMVLRALQ